MDNKILLWLAAVTVAILAIPLIAMQFTSEVDWKLFDFLIMGGLILAMASLFVIFTRKSRSTSDRIVIGISFLLVALYIWAELAVGIFTHLGS